MTEHDYARLELAAALAFWRAHHSLGARRRVREAVAYVRAYAPIAAQSACLIAAAPALILAGAFLVAPAAGLVEG